jgi:hypothetical protein
MPGSKSNYPAQRAPRVKIGSWSTYLNRKVETEDDLNEHRKAVNKAKHDKYRQTEKGKATDKRHELKRGTSAK